MISLGLNGESVSEQELLTGRTCIIAQSGAGKSYGVAVICEELLKKNLGFTVIDTEGEYSSLKQGFDLLLVGGKGADIKINRIDFNELARKVIDNNVAVIFDISENDNPKEAVNNWIKALYDAEEELRKPYLIIIEEADKFVPQRGENLESINEVARRGRKRGLGLMVASQRPAFINKNVLSQCNHQFIGKLTVDGDIKAVNYFFNSRKDLKALPDLLPGEFFVMGFGKDFLMKFKKRLTRHESSTPEIKKTLPSRLKKIINELITSEGPLGIRAKITKEQAKAMIMKHRHRKYLLFGEMEKLKSFDLVYKPLIEAKVSVPVKGFFKSGIAHIFVHLTPDIKVVDSSFKEMFNLAFLKNLNLEEANALLLILYKGVKTIKDLMHKTGLNEEKARQLIKSLRKKGLINQKGWEGKYKTYKAAPGIIMPRVTSLSSEKLNPTERVDADFKEHDVSKIIKLLNPEANVLSSKVIYFPFYKGVLYMDNLERVLWINGVSGEIS